MRKFMLHRNKAVETSEVTPRPREARPSIPVRAAGSATMIPGKAEPGHCNPSCKPCALKLKNINDL
jgi:hypothetical protein